MKKPIYLLRFDDICPTMKWDIWNRVESLMYKYDIKPIIGVIPANEDPTLKIESARVDYWDKLREWQAHGWIIALHGYRHRYENNNHGIIKVNDYSEFAGVPFKEQMDRLSKGLSVLQSEGLTCNTWIAPAHSFDRNTLRCLKEIGIEYVSDGYSNDIFSSFGLKWIPCQLYKFGHKSQGVWTVCKHPSMWTVEEYEAFEKEIDEWHDHISKFEDVISGFDTMTSTQSQLQSKLSSYVCTKNLIKKRIKNMLKCNITLKLKRLVRKCLNGGGNLKRSQEAGVTIGENCRLNDYPRWGSEPWLITLGNHVEISLNVTFLTHDGATWCFRDQDRYKDVIRYGKIVIEDNCFIGANSTILPGVHIGPNTIVGAGSIVTKDLESNSVYAGVPARRICSLEEYAEKCLRQTPKYNKEDYFADKKSEVLRILS